MIKWQANSNSPSSILNALTSVHARGFTAGQKNCGKSGLGHRAFGPPGCRASGLRCRRGPWVVGLLLAKPCFKPASRYLLLSKINSRQENRSKLSFTARIITKYSLERFLSICGEKMSKGFLKFCIKLISIKGAVSRNSAKSGYCKMPVKLKET